MSKILDKLEQVRPYWDAYWKGDVPMLCSVVPHDNANRIPAPPLGITRKTDIKALADSLLKWADANEFLGGAIPYYCVYLFDIYGLLPALFGGEITQAGDSHGMVPFIDDLDTVELVANFDHEVAIRFRDTTRQLQELCGDSILISASAIGGNLDALEAIRGSSNLLMDLYDNPEGVHRCLKQVDKAVAQALEFYAELYDFETFGSVCRHGLYSRGKVAIPQCDFGYMISPEHFKEFALPYLHQEFARLDGVCYHLDGLGNLPNLEPLCNEPDLHCIQWVAGAGHEHEDWSHVFERADELGKGGMRDGPIDAFEQWYAKHKAPWQYWRVYTDSKADITACLKNMGVDY